MVDLWLSLQLYLKKTWCWIVITDTDSLTYEIKPEDVYEEFFMHKRLFDFSNYPKDSDFFGYANKKATGKMKDVLKEKLLISFLD